MEEVAEEGAEKEEVEGASSYQKPGARMKR